MREKLINLIDAFREEDAPGDKRTWTEHLADYLIENGVIIPPCKEGDKLYLVCDIDDVYTIDELTVTAVDMKNIYCSGYVPPRDDTEIRIPISEIGENAFFTREEAEKTLPEIDTGWKEHKGGTFSVT